MSQHSIVGERAPTLVAALFGSADNARRALESLRELQLAEATNATLIQPGEAGSAGHKLEPDSRGIWRTLKRSHLVLGTAGLLLGLLVGFGLSMSDAAVFEAFPLLLPLILAVLGAFVGMLVAGLITVRPDHDVVINSVRSATRKGQWAVIVHPTNADQSNLAYRTLENAGGDMVRSL